MTPKEIASFQAIYKQEFKEEISEKEALEKGTRLINLFKAIIGPCPNKK
jgi:hypothetical protein